MINKLAAIPLVHRSLNLVDLFCKNSFAVAVQILH